uniref:Syntaxin-binding protein 5 n=1 Tax=Schistosoma haematobium TaxID=6185 RepID=A0A094ZSN2_SCHHA
MAAKSKRLLKVIDGIRSWNISSSQPNSSPKSAIEIDEYLKTEHFQVGKGGLVSICGDDVAHLWNIRQKNPEIVHSLQFKREQSQSSHPGKVIQIAENPQDPNKILIGYSSGFLVLWDLKTKQGDARFKHTDSLYSVVWHWDGKSFLTSHNNGLLATWLIRQPQRPVSVICPHAPGEAVPDDYIFYEPIRLVEWLPTRNGEPFIIFSGGGRSPGAQTVIHSSVATTNVSSTSLPNSDSSENDPNLSSSSSCMISSNHMLTIKRGKKLVVLQLDHKLVQFTTLCMSPYTSETMDPYAVAILLQEDLVVIDLLSTNFATFENPYPMDLHSSPVTSCLYLVDCPGDLIPAFYSVSSRRNRTQSGTCAEPDVFSSREWPITGGEWRLSNQQVPELIITGHADGSVRFWDASEVSLTPLYKFRTSKLFANPSTSTSNPVETGSSSLSDAKDINAQYSSILLATESDPLAIHFMHFCSDSRKLLTASGYHTCLLHFSRREINLETASCILCMTSSVSHQKNDRLLASPRREYIVPFYFTSLFFTISILNSSSHRDEHLVMDINMAYDGLDDIGFAYSTGDTFSDDHLNTAENLSGNVTKDTVQQSLPHVSSGSVSSYQSASPTERSSCTKGYFNLLTIVLVIILTAELLLVFRMAIGSEFGIAVVDYVHKICLLSISSSDLLSRGPINLTGSSASGEVKFCDQNNSSAGSTSLANTCIINNQTALKNVHSNSDAAQSSESSSTGYTTRYVLSRTTTVKSELKRAKSQGACYISISERTGSLTFFFLIPFSFVFMCVKITEKCSDLSQFSHPGSLTASSSSLDNLNCETIKTILFSEWISPKQASLYRLRGDIIHISLLDNTGDILPSPSERWDDSFIFKGGAASELSKQASLISCSSICSEGTSMYTNADAYSSTDTGFKSCGGGGGSVRALKESVIRQNTVTTHTSSTSTSGHSSTILSNTMSGGVSTFQSSGTTGLDSPTTSKGFIECDRQLVVLCSEKQARVVALPSQNCLYKVKITETSQVVRASVQRLRPSHNSGTSTASFLACYLANGHFVAFSLPSLRLLMDVDYLPYTECVSRSFAFGQYGQSVYLVSPSELAKITWASDVCANLRDMQGEIFLPSNMPEPPKKNFFKNLLSGTLVSSLDRDELFGEASSGKGTPGATTLLPNARLEKLSGQTGAASSEIARARNAAIERGERLQQLDLQTQEMADQAKGFGRSAAILAAKYEKKDKRWGLPF